MSAPAAKRPPSDSAEDQWVLEEVRACSVVALYARLLGDTLAGLWGRGVSSGAPSDSKDNLESRFAISTALSRANAEMLSRYWCEDLSSRLFSPTGPANGSKSDSLLERVRRLESAADNRTECERLLGKGRSRRVEAPSALRLIKSWVAASLGIKLIKEALAEYRELEKRLSIWVEVARHRGAINAFLKERACELKIGRLDYGGGALEQAEALLRDSKTLLTRLRNNFDVPPPHFPLSEVKDFADRLERWVSPERSSWAPVRLATLLDDSEFGRTWAARLLEEGDQLPAWLEERGQEASKEVLRNHVASHGDALDWTFRAVACTVADMPEMEAGSAVQKIVDCLYGAQSDELAFTISTDLSEMRLRPKQIHREVETTLAQAAKVKLPLVVRAARPASAAPLLRGVIVERTQLSKLYDAAASILHFASSRDGSAQRKIADSAGAVLSLVAQHEVAHLGLFLSEESEEGAEARTKLRRTLIALFDSIAHARMAVAAQNASPPDSCDQMVERLRSALQAEDVPVERRVTGDEYAIEFQVSSPFCDELTVGFPNGPYSRYLVGSNLPLEAVEGYLAQAPTTDVFRAMASPSDAANGRKTLLEILRQPTPTREECAKLAVRHVSALMQWRQNIEASPPAVREYLEGFLAALETDGVYVTPRISFDDSREDREKAIVNASDHSLPWIVESKKRRLVRFGHADSRESLRTFGDLAHRSILELDGSEPLDDRQRNLLRLENFPTCLHDVPSEWTETMRKVRRRQWAVAAYVLFDDAEYGKQALEGARGAGSLQSRFLDFLRLREEKSTVAGRLVSSSLSGDEHAHQWLRFCDQDLAIQTFPRLDAGRAQLVWPTGKSSRGVRVDWLVRPDRPPLSYLGKADPASIVVDPEKASGAYALQPEDACLRWPLQANDLDEGLVADARTVIDAARDQTLRLGPPDDRQRRDSDVRALQRCLSRILTQLESDDAGAAQLGQLTGVLVEAASRLRVSVVPSHFDALEGFAIEEGIATGFLGGAVGSLKLRRFGIRCDDAELQTPEVAVSGGPPPPGFAELREALRAGSLEAESEALEALPNLVVERQRTGDSTPIEALFQRIWLGFVARKIDPGTRPLADSVAEAVEIACEKLFAVWNLALFGSTNDYLSDHADFERYFDFELDGVASPTASNRYGKILKVYHRGLRSDRGCLAVAKVRTEKF